MKFVDEISFRVCSGKGGNGHMSFLRERFKPNGGPDGGDGGKGGSLIFRATTSRNTLVDYRFNKIYRGDDGLAGGKAGMTGRGGKDKDLLVPVGTMIYNDETDELLADLAEANDTYVIEGGRGGKGNAHFKTATMRTPRYAQEGEEGTEIKVRLELKLIADVGLVGLPNAGKSTLLSRISQAKPKIADYPFTTLIPNLGVVSLSQGRSFVAADIPGLIEGASMGIGLGHAFLKHIERCSTYIHLVPADSIDPGEAYHQIRKELASYSPELAGRVEIVVMSKTDMLSDDEVHEYLADFSKQIGKPVVPISSLDGEGLNNLLELAWKEVRAHRGPGEEEEKPPHPADLL